MNQPFRQNLYEEFLEDIAQELDISESRYEAAERAYKSVGQWLERPDSSLRSARPVVHVQGSVALGLAVKPVTDEDHHDVDAVCELSVSKAAYTQQQLKEALGYELALYAKAQNMNEEPERRNRCWTLNYADEAQFHLDTLPAIPDGQAASQVLAKAGVSNQWASTSIAITDERHPDFRKISGNWQRSNPRGYAAWFRSRQQIAFDRLRKAMASRVLAKVENIPEYKVKTPLQAAIQILKRHRDIWGLSHPQRRPISIILTTLAAHAYQQEVTIGATLTRVLADMDRYIESRGNLPWIGNPSDPLENFADKWVYEPDRAQAFFEWLQAAREDFRTAANLSDRDVLITVLSARLGERSVRVAAKKRIAPQSVVFRISRGLRELMAAPHRTKASWPVMITGNVSIVETVVSRKGFRDKKIGSDGPVLPKDVSLRFVARSDVDGPYRVYWQVVNTGSQAQKANGLRGNFEERAPERGQLTKQESTLYSGTHSIQCFIVKNGILVAQSEPFIVNII